MELRSPQYNYPMLSIQLLGTPQVLQDDRPLTIMRKKSRALLYYLAAHDQPLTREQLLAVFWPDSDRVSAQQRGDTDLARGRLSSALAQAEALGPPHLAAQIRLWLVPLLPPSEAHTALNEVRSLAESTGRKRLLEQVIQLEAEQATHH